MKTSLPDGFYQATTPYLCAGFKVKDDWVVQAAPILIKQLAYWMTVAKRIDTPLNTYASEELPLIDTPMRPF